MPASIAERRRYRGGRRPVFRRAASSTPATNIMSHQSTAPPPLLLDAGAGAVTVRSADALAELPPAGPVDSAFAAMALV
jgi:hypothetical protein